MEKHSLTKQKGGKPSRRVGRGGKRGKTSGKGMKGQKSRTGNSTRPELRDIIKKYPKRRGYGKNRARTVVPKPRAQAVNLSDISTHFKDGDEVTPVRLAVLGLAGRVGGKAPRVKLLSRGMLDKKVSVRGMTLSKAARAAVEGAGGTVE